MTVRAGRLRAAVRDQRRMERERGLCVNLGAVLPDRACERTLGCSLRHCHSKTGFGGGVLILRHQAIQSVVSVRGY